jgi:hypothetical protein
MMGLGSVGLDILGFLPPELVLLLGSDAVDWARGLLGERENHFEGFARNWEKPDADEPWANAVGFGLGRRGAME